MGFHADRCSERLYELQAVQIGAEREATLLDVQFHEEVEFMGSYPGPCNHNLHAGRSVPGLACCLQSSWRDQYVIARVTMRSPFTPYVSQLQAS